MRSREALTHPLERNWSHSENKLGNRTSSSQRFDITFSHLLAPVSHDYWAVWVTYVYTSKSFLLASCSILVQRRLICFCCRDARGSFRCYLFVYLTMMVLPSFHCVWLLRCRNYAVNKMYCEIETWEVWENFLKLFANCGWLWVMLTNKTDNRALRTLDLREGKCQEAWKSCIMRNIMISTLNRNCYGRQMM